MGLHSEPAAKATFLQSSLKFYGYGKTSKLLFSFIKNLLSKSHHAHNYTFFRILEVGSSNIFFYLINEKGEKELATPYLDEGLILPGITRDSILVLYLFENRNLFVIGKSFK
jgi:branched-subunit amino acid aminotransferase/4-amino-4-deoxychorismate lyase